MSLRQRLLLAVAVALVLSFAAGTWLTAWQAAHLVRAEVAAALETGQQGFAAIRQDAAPEALVRFVNGFDGSRHVMAELSVAGRVVARSRPAAVSVPSPAWFARLAAPGLAPVDLPVAGGALRLVPLPASETGERWSEARRLILLLAFSSALSALLCALTTAWSLRPLGPLGEAIERLGQGRGALVAERGPPEIARLASAFNRMQSALASAAGENRRLSAQLDRLAEEERAELARDLHDEAGPLLFAITAWAAAARLQAEAGDTDAAGASLRALDAAAAELQQAVRDLLRRLRDSAPVTTDLRPSLEELVEFWRGIRPETRFSLDVDAAAELAAEPAKAALLRVAQEGVSNAIRHGNPSLVQIALLHDAGGLALRVADDGVGGPASGEGFGLIGIEERLHSLGGTLSICRDGGWTLTAWAPAA